MQVQVVEARALLAQTQARPLLLLAGWPLVLGEGGPEDFQVGTHDIQSFGPIDADV